MNPINAALTQGFSNQSILQYLIRQFPHAKKQIEKAVAKGFTADKIVKYLQGGRKEVNSNAPMTEHEKTRATDKERKQNIKSNIGKGALALGATALGGYALSRALPRASTALQGQLLPALGSQGPQQPTQLPNQTINVNPAQLTNQQPQLPAPQQPTPQSNVPPTQPQTQQPIPQQPIQPKQAAPSPPTQPTAPLPTKIQNVLNGILKAKKQQSPEEISNALKKLFPKEIKEYEKTTNMPIIKAVEESSRNIPEKPMEGINTSNKPIETPESIQKLTSPNPLVPNTSIEEDIKSEEQKIEEPKKEINKGSTIALPNGDIGEIVDIRQGIATVNANGKEYRRKLDELIESPLPKKELHELYDDLSEGIELETGEELSKMANMVGYDPNQKALYFHPVGSKKPLYVYTKLSDEEVKELMETEALRRTSGENFVGAWKEGTKSVQGSKLFDFIRKLQKLRGGKGSEYEFKFETIYDALEPAKKAKEEKFKEKQEKARDEKRKTKKPRSN